jgi:hypothetical protein
LRQVGVMNQDRFVADGPAGIARYELRKAGDRLRITAQLVNIARRRSGANAGFLVFLLYTMRRVNCRRCGIVAFEEVPWGDGKRTLTPCGVARPLRYSSCRHWIGVLVDKTSETMAAVQNRHQFQGAEAGRRRISTINRPRPVSRGIDKRCATYLVNARARAALTSSECCA